MDLFGTKVSSTKECITPHKISLLVLISELCHRNNKDFNPINKHRHNLMLLLLKMIQVTDIEFHELRTKLNQLDDKWQISALLLERLKNVQQGESNMCDFFFHELDDLLNPEGETMLTRTSFFGLFARKMLLLFNKMSFGQVLHLTALLKRYVLDAATYETERAEDEMEKKGKRDWHQRRIPVSNRQAENFLTKQAMLIQSNEHAADSPHKIQQEIMTILQGAPDLTEAYFVQYLNYIRVGEFNNAIDCLYHYFDRKQWDDSSTTESDETKKDRCKRFCYAALNLAILHTHFNHRDEALTALQESIRIAQESNDHVCLAHGLRLLYKLNQDGDSHAKQILERFRARAAELKIPYLESLSCLLKAKRMVFEGVPPPKVLSAFNEVNILNSEKSLLDLSVTTHVQQTACFEFYGKSNMAIVFSQFPLHQWKTSFKFDGVDMLNGNSRGIINSEATIRALCYLASHIYRQGNFPASMKLLDCAQSIHSESSKYSKLWQAEKQKICFDQAMIMENWKGAEEAINNLRVYEPIEADLRSARLKIKKELYDAAHKKLRKLLDLLEENTIFTEEEISTEEFKANVYLAMGELHIAIGDYPSSMAHLLHCKATCDSYYMQNLAAITALFIIEVQLQLNLPEKAHTLINQVMIQILGHGSLFTICSAKLLSIRCDLVQSQPCDKEARKAVLLASLSTLDGILNGFKQIQASAKIREVLFYQAFIYNEMGYTNKRNNCALEFRSLYTKDIQSGKSLFLTPL